MHDAKSSICDRVSTFMQIGLDIPYAPAFSQNSLPISLRNLAFERASILFNLAALYSQLASNEDRSHLEGIKRAIAYYQVRISLTLSGSHLKIHLRMPRGPCHTYVHRPCHSYLSTLRMKIYLSISQNLLFRVWSG